MRRLLPAHQCGTGGDCTQGGQDGEQCDDPVSCPVGLSASPIVVAAAHGAHPSADGYCLSADQGIKMLRNVGAGAVEIVWRLAVSWSHAGCDERRDRGDRGESCPDGRGHEATWPRSAAGA